MNDELVPKDASTEAPKVVENFSLTELLDELGDDVDITSVVVQGKRWHIKKLSLGELLKISGRSVRTDANGQITRNLETEGRNRVMYAIHMCIVKSVNDTTPFFTLKQVTDKLIDNPRANTLVDGLLAQILVVNPDIKNG